MQTRAERTGYRETSLHADVMSFIAALAAKGDPRLHVTSFGVSPGGRELPLLVLSTRGVRTPAEARAAAAPVVLVLDGIHPGEVEGKEASLALVRDILDGKEGAWLDAMTLLVAPLFNPDGNDAIDPANRRLDLAHLTGQPGPVWARWRAANPPRFPRATASTSTATTCGTRRRRCGSSRSACASRGRPT